MTPHSDNVLCHHQAWYDVSPAHTPVPAQKGTDFHSKHPPPLGEEVLLITSPTISTSRARDSIKPVSDQTRPGLKALQGLPILSRTKPKLWSTQFSDMTHLPLTPPPALCPCIPATLTNLFHEHTCLRAFALAASPAWNVPSPDSCLTPIFFSLHLQEMSSPPYFKLHPPPQHCIPSFPASMLDASPGITILRNVYWEIAGFYKGKVKSCCNWAATIC